MQGSFTRVTDVLIMDGPYQCVEEADHETVRYASVRIGFSDSLIIIRHCMDELNKAYKPCVVSAVSEEQGCGSLMVTIIVTQE